MFLLDRHEKCQLLLYKRFKLCKAQAAYPRVANHGFGVDGPKRERTLDNLVAAIIKSMVRRVVILLLMLLPLQFAWSAAAVYCSHETAPTAQHFGHHVHAHKSAQADDGAKAKADSTVADNDCPVCHMGGPSLPPDVVVFTGMHAVPPQHPAAGMSYSSAPLGTPERPNWLRAT